VLQVSQQPITAENTKKLGRVAGLEPRTVTLHKNGSSIVLDKMASEATSLAPLPVGDSTPSQGTVISYPSPLASDRMEQLGPSKPSVLAHANEAQVIQQPVTSFGRSSFTLKPVLQSGSSLAVCIRLVE
jgi:hypothetical protein